MGSSLLQLRAKHSAVRASGKRDSSNAQALQPAQTASSSGIITRCATLFIPDNSPQADRFLISLPN
jgi:hypothetical protein